MSSVWQLIGEETDAVGEGRLRRGGRLWSWTNLCWQLQLPDLEKADVAEVRRSSKAKQPRWWAHLEIETRAAIMPVGLLFRFPPHIVSRCWQSWWFKRVASWSRGWGEANEAAAAVRELEGQLLEHKEAGLGCVLSTAVWRLRQWEPAGEPEGQLLGLALTKYLSSGRKEERKRQGLTPRKVKGFLVLQSVTSSVEFVYK